MTLEDAMAYRLTPEEKARLDAMTDADIDFSDCPDMSGVTGWTRPGALVAAENKQQITLRLDADVLHFFKGTGKKYQSRMNAVLREYMLAQHGEASQGRPTAAARGAAARKKAS